MRKGQNVTMFYIYLHLPLLWKPVLLISRFLVTNTICKNTSTLIVGIKYYRDVGSQIYAIWLLNFVFIVYYVHCQFIKCIIFSIKDMNFSFNVHVTTTCHGGTNPSSKTSQTFFILCVLNRFSRSTHIQPVVITTWSNALCISQWNSMGLLLDAYNYGLRMRRECRKRSPPPTLKETTS